MKGLIVGLANENSLAWGCAQAFHAMGCDLAITYQNEKTFKFIEPLVDRLGASIVLPLDVTSADEMDQVFAMIAERWGRLDFILHSIAFAPKADLQGRLTDCSAEGFAMAMDVSCHSLMRLARRAEPLMVDGGSILTMSFYGAEKVVPNYNLMGPVKAALEASVRYLAHDLGPSNIRVNALSTGPVRTRAASGLSHLDELLATAAEKSPLQRLVTLQQIGQTAAFLVTDKASGISGQVIYVDAGYNTNG
ncbi:enoyl-ACP reductase FabI [Asticcacaulis sp. AC402]|uniref:enoyl-ACP reductase FabI n=1 Tax=Asticcacaulis sp. AC402 TaxID=1282361 RepID=UPI0003C3BB1F|nr:enoyl-ACP reductase FabI [Asticcacaulis sp. AC402]ESQ73667.1 hypothetical protein ABAC402_18140 [Asticcacaulis sp. AC402]